MADIFNKKEEVISFELTKHGRKMFGNGILQPSYVSFFDDSVIYDAQNGELQNDTAQRIFDAVTFKSLTLDDKALQYPMGRSSYSNDYAPAWNIIFLKGTQSDQIVSKQVWDSNLNKYVSLNSSYYLKQFQFSDITYIVEMQDQDNMFIGPDSLSTFDLENGKNIKVTDDYIILELQEANSDDDFRNFEIELYVEDINAGDRLMRQLSFYQKPSNIIDGIIYSDSELPTKYRKLTVNKDNSEYFFDILVDDEIDRELIIGAIKTLPETIKGTYMSTFTGPVKDDC
jgi:hypothetical protein